MSLDISVIAEGCLDKAVAEWLFQRIKKIRPLSINMYGGWPTAISHAVELALQPTRVPFIVFVDADNDPYEKSRYLEKLLKNRKATYSKRELNKEPLVIEYVIHRNDNTVTMIYLFYWCPLSRKCASGTLEELLWEMVEEKYGCIAYDNIPVIQCEHIKCRKYKDKYRKLSVLTYLAAASCRWELTDIGEKRCGIPVADALQKLSLHTTRPAKLYTETLLIIRNRIAEIFSSP